MTYYEFLNNKNEHIKLVTDKLDINVLLKAFNSIEAKKDIVECIRLNKENFDILVNEIKKDKFEGEKLCQIISTQNKLWNADIIIDDNENTNIIIFIGKKHKNDNLLQLFLIK
jgi:hypothetical protein